MQKQKHGMMGSENNALQDKGCLWNAVTEG